MTNRTDNPSAAARPAVPQMRSRGRTSGGIVAAVIAAVLVLCVGCGTASSAPGAAPADVAGAPRGTAPDQAPGAPAPAADPEKAGQVDASHAGLTLKITNNSTYDLLWVNAGGSPDPASTPRAVIPARGGTDQITFKGTGIEIHPTWLVSGAGASVYPAVGVPLVGANGIVCTVDEASHGSPVGPTSCKIGHGWDPEADITFSNWH